MKNPSIVFTAPAVAEFTDYTYPEALGAHEVRLRLMASTISAGTERAVLDGKLPAAGYKGFPRQSGYSAAAIVDAVGEAVTRVKVGDRVAASWMRHSMFYVLPESQVYPLPEGVSFAEGALVHIATFPLAAIRKCRLEIGESAIVMGLGVLGLIGIELLKAAGAVPIIAVDPVPEKRTLALSLGADVVFCLHGRCARARGIGEILTPVRSLSEDLYIVIAKGERGVNTKKAYADADLLDAYDIKSADALISTLEKGTPDYMRLG